MTLCDDAVKSKKSRIVMVPHVIKRRMAYRLNIRARREKMRMSKSLLGALIGKSVSTISAYERDPDSPNARQPSAIDLLHIAEALDCAPGDLYEKID